MGTAESKEKQVDTFVRDGSTASRAIPPGESEPGWGNELPGHGVVHGDISDIASNTSKRQR